MNLREAVGDEQEGGRRYQPPLDVKDVCTRKAPGTAGTPIQVTTNVFPLRFTPTHIHRWVVEFDPQIPPEKVKQRRIVFGRFGPTLRNMFSFSSFDGTCLLTIEKPQSVINLDAGDGKELKEGWDPYGITIRWIKEIRTDNVTSQEVNNVVNVMTKKLLRRLKLILFGRSYYYPKPVPVQVNYHRNTPPDERFRLQMYKGFLATVQPTMVGNVMTIDLTNRVMEEESVRELMNRMELKARQSKRTRAEYHDMMKKQLSGKVVLAPHNNRIWRIDEVDFTKNVDSKFEKKDRSSISFREYYTTRYPEVAGKVAQSTKAGLLVNRPSKARTTLRDTVLLPELCYLTGVTDAMKKNFSLMKALASKTRLPPSERVAEIHKLVQDILSNSAAAAAAQDDKDNKQAELPIQLGGRPVDVKARVLPNCQIHLPNARPQTLTQNKQFASPIRCAGFFGGTPTIARWAIVCDRKDARAGATLAQHLMAQAQQQKVRMARPMEVPVSGNSRQVGAWQAAIDQAMEAKDGEAPTFLAIVIPREENIYSFVKHWCNVQKGVVSQVFCTDTLSKANALKTICCSAFKQIMAKCGFQNWQVNIKQFLGDHAPHTMMVGVDVSHDKLVKKAYGPKGAGRSTVGFVATRDQTFGSFNSFLSYQDPLTELITEAQRLMTSALQAWYAEHKSFPRNIIVYRDGVGDSQLTTFVRMEIKHYEAAFSALNIRPKLTVIVVQKRISLRVFGPCPVAHRTAQRCPYNRCRGNERFHSPMAGTVVDNTITSSLLSDFYLVPSDAPPRACARPTRFITVRDDLNIPSDNLQNMTNHLCYMYSNWPGPIRAPACVMYAHKLAYLFGKLVTGNPKATLTKNLFYI